MKKRNENQIKGIWKDCRTGKILKAINGELFRWHEGKFLYGDELEEHIRKETLKMKRIFAELSERDEDKALDAIYQTIFAMEEEYKKIDLSDEEQIEYFAEHIGAWLDIVKEDEY